MADLSLRKLHSWHVEVRIVDQTVKVHIVTVDVSRTVSSSLGPALRHRFEVVSSSLDLEPPANGVSSSLVHLPPLSIWTSVLVIGPHLRMGPLFLLWLICGCGAPRVQRMADVPTWRLFLSPHRPIVISTNCSRSSSLAALRWVARFGEPAFEGSAHPLERSLFLCASGCPSRQTG